MKLSRLKQKSPEHAKAVTNLIADMQKLVAYRRTIFRYKSNGDEWIYVLYSAMPEASTKMLEDVLRVWEKLHVMRDSF